MSLEDFHRWWLDEHTTLVKRFPGLKKYTINLATTPDQRYEGRIRRGFIGVGEQPALWPRRLVRVLQLPLPATAYLFVLTVVTEER